MADELEKPRLAVFSCVMLFLLSFCSGYFSYQGNRLVTVGHDDLIKVFDDVRTQAKKGGVLTARYEAEWRGGVALGSIGRLGGERRSGWLCGLPSLPSALDNRNVTLALPSATTTIRAGGSQTSSRRGIPRYEKGACCQA